jgi:hypothetical protein
MFNPEQIVDTVILRDDGRVETATLNIADVRALSDIDIERSAPEDCREIPGTAPSVEVFATNALKTLKDRLLKTADHTDKAGGISRADFLTVLRRLVSSYHSAQVYFAHEQYVTSHRLARLMACDANFLLADNGATCHLAA